MHQPFIVTFITLIVLNKCLNETTDILLQTTSSFRTSRKCAFFLPETIQLDYLFLSN